VIVEGFRVLPHLVRPLLAMPGHAVWLPPMTDFRRAASDSRCSLWVPLRLPVRWSLWPQPAQGHTRLGCGRPTRSAALLGACRLVTRFISKEEPSRPAAGQAAMADDQVKGIPAAPDDAGQDAVAVSVPGTGGAWPAGPSWRGSCECYPLWVAAVGSRWLLLLLSPLLSAAGPGPHRRGLPGVVTAPCPSQAPPPNPIAAEPDGRRVLSRVGVADHAVTLKAPWTGSGWREYSYGGFGGGHPHFHPGKSRLGSVTGHP
jgi:hypothetical protein